MIAKLLAPKVPLVLIVKDEAREHKLELQLMWNMRAVTLMETRSRELGSQLNILKFPVSFWTQMDCTTLAVAIWACAQQADKEYASEDGFDVIASYLVSDNYPTAIAALRNAYIESLSPERQKKIRDAEKAEKAGEPISDPPQAPTQEA